MDRPKGTAAHTDCPPGGETNGVEEPVTSAFHTIQKAIAELKEYALFFIAAQDRADSPFNALDDPQQVWRDLTELDDELRAAGAFVFSRGLQPPDAAVTFRAEAGGEVVELAGPFGPTTLSGMWIIDVPGAEEARAWARRCATAHRCDVELRPFQPHVSDYIEDDA